MAEAEQQIDVGGPRPDAVQRGERGVRVVGVQVADSVRDRFRPWRWPCRFRDRLERGSSPPTGRAAPSLSVRARAPRRDRTDRRRRRAGPRSRRRSRSRAAGHDDGGKAGKARRAPPQRRPAGLGEHGDEAADRLRRARRGAASRSASVWMEVGHGGRSASRAVQTFAPRAIVIDKAGYPAGRIVAGQLNSPMHTRFPLRAEPERLSASRPCAVRRCSIPTWRARRGGRLLLRIEDIDATRCRPEYEAAIYEDLAWLGIAWERAGAAAVRAFRRLPRRRSRKLEAMGLVYPSFESRARDRARWWPSASARTLAARSRRRAALSGRRAKDAVRPSAPAASPRASPMRCGSTWRRRCARAGALDLDRDRRRPAAARPARRRQPRSAGATSSWRARRRRPAIISPWWSTTRLQGVTDVVRGQDLFWATSVHRLLQALLGLPEPAYHHHRLILDADGRKLSKSTQATACANCAPQAPTPADIRRHGRARS